MHVFESKDCPCEYSRWLAAQLDHIQVHTAFTSGIKWLSYICAMQVDLAVCNIMTHVRQHPCQTMTKKNDQTLISDAPSAGLFVAIALLGVAVVHLWVQRRSALQQMVLQQNHLVCMRTYSNQLDAALLAGKQRQVHHRFPRTFQCHCPQAHGALCICFCKLQLSSFAFGSGQAVLNY